MAKPVESMARIKLEDGTVIHCTTKEIPRLVSYRLTVRMDISMYERAFSELTGRQLPQITPYKSQ